MSCKRSWCPFTHTPGSGIEEAEREDLVWPRRATGSATAPCQQGDMYNIYNSYSCNSAWCPPHLLRVKRIWQLLLHFHLPNLMQDHRANTNPEWSREGNSEKPSLSLAKLTAYKPAPFCCAMDASCLQLQVKPQANEPDRKTLIHIWHPSCIGVLGNTVLLAAGRGMLVGDWKRGWGHQHIISAIVTRLLNPYYVLHAVLNIYIYYSYNLL